MTIHQVLCAGYANPLRVVDGADFDGTNDYMRTAAGLVGVADSKLGIFSCWVRLDGTPFGGEILSLSDAVSGGNTLFKVTPEFGGKINIYGFASGPASCLRLRSNSTYSASGTWLHVLASWDMATGGTARLYINDVDECDAVTYNNLDLDYTLNDTAVGSNTAGANKFDGCLAEVYFAPGQYLDFSLAHHRRKFISATGKPVHLGLTGSLPTGTPPAIYLHLDDGESVSNFYINRSGTSWDFSITGALATASDSPSD